MIFFSDFVKYYVSNIIVKLFKKKNEASFY